MTREKIFGLVNEERDRQDREWRTGGPIEAQYSFAASHVLILEEKLTRLRSLWYDSKPEQMKEEFVKIAAIAVRAIEEVTSFQEEA